MNFRLIRLNGTHTNPSMSTHSDSSWIRLVAPGDPRKVATEGREKEEQGGEHGTGGERQGQRGTGYPADVTFPGHHGQADSHLVGAEHHRHHRWEMA